jgi:hypothetical protein
MLWGKYVPTPTKGPRAAPLTGAMNSRRFICPHPSSASDPHEATSECISSPRSWHCIAASQPAAAGEDSYGSTAGMQTSHPARSNSL